MDRLVTAISAECCTTPEVSSGRLPTEAALRASVPVNTRVNERTAGRRPDAEKRGEARHERAIDADVP
eukprot:8587346-Alexandrium_andersonii.AAC.1